MSYGLTSNGDLWMDHLKQAEIYTKKADQKRLAGAATRLLVPGHFGAAEPLLQPKGEAAN